MNDQAHSQAQVIVIWCDSPSGLVSTRADQNNHILRFDREQLPEIKILTSPEEVFDILKKRDGTKIAIPTNYVSEILGWDLGNSNGHSTEPAASAGVSA